jgi:hypothetical protein
MLMSKGIAGAHLPAAFRLPKVTFGLRPAQPTRNESVADLVSPEEPGFRRPAPPG